MTQGLRYPRTLREAFGPDAELDMELSEQGDALIGRLAFVILCLVALALWLGWNV